MKLTRKAEKLVAEIAEQYELLTVDKNGFFNTYHDTMLCQVQGARETAREVEVYETRGDIKFATDSLGALTDTLAYCKAVIALQKATESLPEPIYG